MLKKGVWMDPDINKYDLNHRVSHHSKMTDPEWEDVYYAAWASFYSYDHIRTILSRAAQIPNGRPKPILSTIGWFKLMIEYEGVHPLEGGAFRLKYRRDRRRGLRSNRPSSSIRATATGSSQGVALLAILPADRRILKEVLRRPTVRPTATSQSSRRATTNSNSCRSITRPAAAKRRLSARRSATAFADARRASGRRYPRRRRNKLGHGRSGTGQSCARPHGLVAGEAGRDGRRARADGRTRSKPARPIPSRTKRSTKCAPRSRPPASSSSRRMAAEA